MESDRRFAEVSRCRTSVAKPCPAPQLMSDNSQPEPFKRESNLSSAALIRGEQEHRELRLAGPRRLEQPTDGPTRQVKIVHRRTVSFAPRVLLCWACTVRRGAQSWS